MFSITLLYRSPLINGQKSHALIAKKMHNDPIIAGSMPPCDEDAAEDERFEECCSTGAFVGSEEVGDESSISGGMLWGLSIARKVGESVDGCVPSSIFSSAASADFPHNPPASSRYLIGAVSKVKSFSFHIDDSLRYTPGTDASTDSPLSPIQLVGQSTGPDPASYGHWYCDRVVADEVPMIRKGFVHE